MAMDIAGGNVRQRDRFSCGPSVAVLAAALLAPRYGVPLGGSGAVPWFDAEQRRVHREANRFWPRRLGMTPSGVAGVINRRSPAPYRWRLCRSLLRRTEPLNDVIAALRAGRPVAMLVGSVIPRHWVLFVGLTPDGRQLHCYEPTSGAVRPVDVLDVHHAELSGLGFPRPFAFVLPRSTRCVP